MKAKKAKKIKDKEVAKKEDIKGTNPSNEFYVLARCKRNEETKELEDCYRVPVTTFVDPCCFTAPGCCC